MAISIGITREQMLEMVEAGLTDAEIATKMAYTTKYVEKLRRRYGIKKTQNGAPTKLSVEIVSKLVDQKFTAKEIADLLGSSRGTVGKFMSRHKIKCQHERKGGQPKADRSELAARMQALVNRGFTNERLADELGYSVDWVKKLRAICNVKPYKKRAVGPSKRKVNLPAPPACEIRTLLEAGYSKKRLGWHYSVGRVVIERWFAEAGITEYERHTAWRRAKENYGKLCKQKAEVYKRHVQRTKQAAS